VPVGLVALGLARHGNHGLWIAGLDWDVAVLVVLVTLFGKGLRTRAVFRLV